MITHTQELELQENLKFKFKFKLFMVNQDMVNQDTMASQFEGAPRQHDLSSERGCLNRSLAPSLPIGPGQCDSTGLAGRKLAERLTSLQTSKRPEI
jgi:hypothetical protein